MDTVTGAVEYQGSIWYSPITGQFWRRNRNGAVYLCAGTLDSSGYLGFKLGGKTHRAHQIAWFCMTGAVCSKLVDHINRVKTDNQWCNLREATRSENRANSKQSVRNKSGVRGVSWNPMKNKWAVDIRMNGQCFRGYYMTLEEATINAATARLTIQKEFNNAAQGI